MRRMIKFGNRSLYLISNDDFWVNFDKFLEIHNWCLEKWGYSISCDDTGRWEHFAEGFVFRYETDKIEFMLRWL